MPRCRDAGGRDPDRRRIDYEPRVWYNPELESTQFLVPGLIGFILMLTAVLSTALSVVREKERGTMEQLRVTSLKPGELILGKTLPYLGISLVATVLILAGGAVPLRRRGARAPTSTSSLATLVYLIGALGFGLLVSTVADTQAMAFQVGALVSMLPAIFLSGFIFPIRSMPPVLQVDHLRGAGPLLQCGPARGDPEGRRPRVLSAGHGLPRRSTPWSSWASPTLRLDAQGDLTCTPSSR